MPDRPSHVPSSAWNGLIHRFGPIEVHFRFVQISDEPLIAEAIRTASPETLLHRFFTPVRSLSHQELERYLSVDQNRDCCVVGEIHENGRKRIICGARFIRIRNSATAEFAMTVHDDFQGRGMGSFLLRLISRLAAERGITRFIGDVMGSNRAMMALLRKIAPDASSEFRDSIYHVAFNIPIGS